MTNQYTKQLAQALALAYERLKGHGGWREVSRVHFDGEIPAGTLNRIANSGGKYLPAVPGHLEKLLVPAEAWPMRALIQKQLVDKSKLRKRKQRQPKAIQQMSKKELLLALENREDLC